MAKVVSSSEIWKISKFSTCTISTIYYFAIFQKNLIFFLGFYTPCPCSRKIVGHIQLGPYLLLKNVLHVPELLTSLVSI